MTTADEPCTGAQGECRLCHTRVSGPLMDIARAEWEGAAYTYCERCGAVVWLTLVEQTGGE